MIRIVSPRMVAAEGSFSGSVGNCKRCGAELPPGALICKNCRRASASPAQQAVPASPPPPQKSYPSAASSPPRLVNRPRRRWYIVAAALAAILLVGGLTTLLNGHAPSTPATGPNTINLSGALTLSQKITSICKLGINQTIYVVVATFPDAQHQDTALYHYQLSFWIEAYHGPGTYRARDFVLDKVALIHFAPNVASGHLTADATYTMADRTGQVIVNADGLSGNLKQDVAAGPSSARIYMSANWQCGLFEQLS